MTATRDEMEELRGTLGSARRHVLSIIDGLTPEQMTGASLPSGWTPVEMVLHLTLGGERYWISGIVGGEPLDWVPEGERADWQTPPDATPADIVDGYRQQIASSDSVLESCDPSAPPRRCDPLWDEWGVEFPTIRSVLLHMIVETATHAGHLDAAVELIDGRQRLVLG